jgi:hypothetical protein
MDKKAAKHRVKAEQAAVRAILMKWDPFGGSPDGEFDCLVDHGVSALHQGKTKRKDIAGIITSELTEHFEIEERKATISKVAEDIASYGAERRA